MPLDIQAYKDVSNRGIGQLALNTMANGPRITDAETRGVGFLARFFNTSSSKAVNNEIRADFHRAMVREYGREIANAAFKQYLGSADGLHGKALSSTKVRLAIAVADRMIASRLRPPQGSHALFTLRSGTGSLTVRNNQGTRELRDQMKTAAKLICDINDHLNDLPMDALGFEDFQAHADKIRREADNLMRTGFANSADPQARQLKGELERRLALMPAKMAEAEAVCRQAPNAYGKIVSFVEKMAQAAKNVVSSLQGNDGDNIQRSDRFGKTPLARLGIASSLLKLNKAGGVLDDLVRYVKGELRLAQITNPDLREAFRAMLPERPEGARDTDACKDVGRWLDQKFQSRLAKFCVAALKAGMTGPAIEDLKESSILNVFEKGIKAEFKNVLNTTGWNTIDKSLTFWMGGVTYTGRSVITPASQMGGYIGRQYANAGKKGIMCHCRDERNHAVNLSSSSFTVNVGGQDKLAFSGIRHGVHAAVDIDNDAQFAEANKNRAKEAILAAFTSRADLMQKAMAFRQGDAAIEFDMTSLSLLTPGVLGTGHSNEAKMLRGQNAAYRHFNNREIELPIVGEGGQTRTIKIKPRIATFNFGVNFLAQTHVFSSLSGGWYTSGGINSQGWRDFCAFVNREMAAMRTRHSPAEAAKLRACEQLFRQLNAIMNGKTYKNDHNEAYKAPARIAVLAHLLGGVPAWNCKSGKDRTSVMDVECKFIATLVAMGKPVPEPGAQLTQEQIALHRELFLQAGNLELQEYNTGVAGYKSLTEVSSNVTRTGKGYIDYAKGLSKAVKT